MEPDAIQDLIDSARDLALCEDECPDEGCIECKKRRDFVDALAAALREEREAAREYVEDTADFWQDANGYENGLTPPSFIRWHEARSAVERLKGE